MVELTVVVAAVVANLTIFGILSDLTGERIFSPGLKSAIFSAMVGMGIVYFTISFLRLGGVLTYPVRYEDPYELSGLWFMALGLWPSFWCIISGTIGGSLVGLLLRHRVRVVQAMEVLAGVFVVLGLASLFLYFYL